uniref:Uncharacterized protein n=1 Tax=Anopheles farauti TaxID=69004 RepID=A0A182QKB5_9DIPT
MPAAHVQQSVLQRLIPMLVLLSIAAALPATLPLDRSESGRNAIADINQRRSNGEGIAGAPTHTPQYEFAYGVKDSITGDHKDHWERRDGDRVRGVYLFEEADGTQRIVEYEADDERGFRAIVTNVPLPTAKGTKEGNQSSDPIAHSYSMLRAAS